MVDICTATRGTVFSMMQLLNVTDIHKEDGVRKVPRIQGRLNEGPAGLGHRQPQATVLTKFPDSPRQGDHNISLSEDAYTG